MGNRSNNKGRDNRSPWPRLSLRTEKGVDERHQSNHFGDRPIKEHLERSSGEKKAEMSNESSSIQIGDKSLNAAELSNESSSIQIGDKGLNATELSNLSSQEGNGSLDNTKKKDTSGAFEQSNHGREKWGIYLMRMTKTRAPKAQKSPGVARKINSSPLLGAKTLVCSICPPMKSNSLRTERNPEESGIVLPGTNPLPTSPFKDGRAYSFVSEKEGRMNPNQTQVQESSSVAESAGNRNEGKRQERIYSKAGKNEKTQRQG